MDISWEDARLFLAVAEAGSLSGAARALRLGQPTVTRRLAALEYALGTALFRRSVEGAALTAAGERLVGPAKKMAEWAGELQRAAAANDSTPRGVVRVTASPLVAFDFLAPFAAFVAQKHPGLRLEVSSSVQYLDLGRGEADVALRGKAPSNPDLKVVESLQLESSVFVSKELKARLPKRPKLSDIPFVAWCPPYDAVPPNPQLEAAIPGFTPSFTADNFLVMLAAAEAGLGAMVLGRVKHRFSRESRLVPLDLDLGPYARQTSYLVCAKSALDVPRVRRVVELLQDELKRARPG
ncbi:MAG: LysR family transcriptional regulator [Myxococcaceae bacterium]